MQCNSSIMDQLNKMPDLSDLELPFEMPEVKLPQFAGKCVDIRDYGAVPDGKTLNTKAITDAINDCAAAGGGSVVIPAGLWLTGPIELKSGINLYTEKNAYVLFTRKYDEYPFRTVKFHGITRTLVTSPLFGYRLENIAITGEGIFDGSGDAWRPVKKSKMTEGQWKELIASGGAVNDRGDMWWPTRDVLEAQMYMRELFGKGEAEYYKHPGVKTAMRPNLMHLIECRNVLLDGPTFQNSPSWNLHPYLCENMIIRNITIKNPWYSQNGDGLDIQSCKNVILYDSTLDVGDDAICIKSGKDKQGREIGVPTENVIIKDCTVYHGHGGFVIGSEMSGGVKNFYVTGCTFIGTDTGLRFKSTRGRGGVVENIHIGNINMVNIAREAILFDLYYGLKGVTAGGEPAPEVAATEETPQFKDIHMKNIICIGAETAIYLRGLPEMPLSNISLKNVYITAAKGLTQTDTVDVTLKDVVIETA